MQPGILKLKEIKPVLYGFVREADLLLSAGEVPDEHTIHDVRVIMKKSRASVKLVKSRIGAESFTREYSAFREAGRLMRSWRESTVHQKILKNLKKRYPSVFAQLEGNNAIESVLNARHGSSEKNTAIIGEAGNIRDLLRKSGYRIRFMNMDTPDPATLLSELGLTYAAASGCFMAARNRPGAKNLHDFRKRVKDFLYQLYFFRPANPKKVKGLESRLDSIARNLGKFNDLAVLIRMLGYRYEKDQPSSGIDHLVLILRQEQDRYLSAVWAPAYSIFTPGQSLAGLLGFKFPVAAGLPVTGDKTYEQDESN